MPKDKENNKPEIREGEVINKVVENYFEDFDCTKLLGDVDFCVCLKSQKGKNLFDTESLFWAEAKKGKSNINNSIIQLLLTIGKAKTYNTYFPPAYLGAFDSEKIAFIPYNEIHDVFYITDFNWRVKPSDHETKEFKILSDKVESIISKNSLSFDYKKDSKEIKEFIKTNFILGKSETSKIKIDKNNFVSIYNKWLDVVKPTISVNWDAARKNGIIDGDFYLADILSRENESIKDKLFVVLKATNYEFNKHKDEYGAFTSSHVDFIDSQKAHKQFWNKYERPPKEEYWDYIIERRDLLVPQDVRQRKGSYFTPKEWVDLSQEYLAKTFGENWQEEYYIWDCAAGTGNLLANLTEKYNIWASTLDKQDVEVMHERIRTMNENSINGDGANLLDSHVFQFDFLNDEFNKLPSGLQEIINDPEKRKKLIIYINPPYAEAASTATITGKTENKKDVAVQTEMYKKYQQKIGIAARELYVQFLTRIYCEIPDVIIGQFSTLKTIQAPNFEEFRNLFKSKLKKLFIVPANTFDNVKGKFPIGFFIWDTSDKEKFNSIDTDVYDDKGIKIQIKNISIDENKKSINDWIISTRKRQHNINIGFLSAKGNDFQNTGFVFIINNKSQLPHPRGTDITDLNLIEVSVYYSVRHCIEPTWLNDRDQFTYPNDKWNLDKVFKNDCLTYTLFHTNIKSDFGINHWIPFTEKEVNSREKFKSHFMTDFIYGKLDKKDSYKLNLDELKEESKALVFSLEAQNVFNAGRELWKYYHKQPNCNVNASLYDIREWFQGRNEGGKMNNKSTDENYTKLISELRDGLKILAKKIEPKIYEYGFLK